MAHENLKMREQGVEREDFESYVEPCARSRRA